MAKRVNINALDFFQSFQISRCTVGVIGHGYIGRAVHEFFEGSCRVMVYDKAMPEFGTLTDVVGESEVIFVAVPTPMRNDGSCHTGIVESVLADIKSKAREMGRSLESFIVVIKSTVVPGFTVSAQEKFFPMRILFSPEFLTEKNSVQDFKTTNRIILGGAEDDAKVVSTYFNAVQPARVANDELLLLHCDSIVAELVKLYSNGILAAKVMFSNEMYLICRKLGASFEDVRVLATLDRRIGDSHTRVPGHDGDLGFGGHCFPKDVASLKSIAENLGTGERLITAIIERNEELRQKKDWLEMKGRAVIDE